MLKVACLCLALILSGSLFATGLLAYGDCYKECCCKTSLPQFADTKMQSPMGCCAESSQKSCDMQSKDPFNLPEVISVSSSVFQLDIFKLTTVLVNVIGDQINSGNDLILVAPDQKFKSLPLFLHNRSLLI